MTDKYDGIIFDMDGVLVDSEFFYYERRKAFLKEQQLSIDTLPISLFIGADMRSLWPIILDNHCGTYNLDHLTQAYEEYKHTHPIDYSQLIDPDAKRTLQFFKRNKYKIGLASSSTMDVIHEVLDTGDLTSYFDIIVSGTQFEKSKPSPQIYTYIAEKLALDPSRCLVIEDSEKGIQAAHAAQMTVWAIKDTRFGLNQELASVTLDSLSDICKKIHSGV